jgi:hypothetical protein
MTYFYNIWCNNGFDNWLSKSFLTVYPKCLCGSVYQLLLNGLSTTKTIWFSQSGDHNVDILCFHLWVSYSICGHDL